MRFAVLVTTLVIAATQPPGKLKAEVNSAASVRLVGVKPGKPPLQRLLVDVNVRNDSHTPRWVLLPSHLPIGISVGGIDKLEQLTAKAGTTDVAIGRFLGTGGRYALRLGPGASVTLHKLEVRWWSEGSAKETEFDVQFADEVTLAGEPMSSWFDRDPTIEGALEVDMDNTRHTHSHRAPQNKEVEVVVTGGVTTSFRLPAP